MSDRLPEDRLYLHHIVDAITRIDLMPLKRSVEELLGVADKGSNNV